VGLSVLLSHCNPYFWPFAYARVQASRRAWVERGPVIGATEPGAPAWRYLVL